MPKAAHAAPGMCTITGTVYVLPGTPLVNGSVIFRSTFTQTFSNDTVAASPEYVTTNASGQLPAGVQLPLGSRVIITVQGDPQSHPVTVTTNPANCPLSFGSLLGASAGIVVPSTVVTSITAVNNFPGLTLTVQNPVAAGPATLTESVSGTGTWTPSQLCSGGNPTPTGVTSSGYYETIGNMIFFSGFMGWTGSTGGSGNGEIGGLPFADVGPASGGYRIDIMDTNATPVNAGNTLIAAEIFDTNNFINIYETNFGSTGFLTPLACANAFANQPSGFYVNGFYRFQ